MLQPTALDHVGLLVTDLERSLKHDLAISFTSSSLRAERSNLVQIEIPGSEIASSLRSSQ
jgi:hypothetical protein